MFNTYTTEEQNKMQHFNEIIQELNQSLKIGISGKKGNY